MSAKTHFGLAGLLCLLLASKYASPQSNRREIEASGNDMAFSSSAETEASQPDSDGDTGSVRKITPGHQKMLALLKDTINRTPDENVYFGDSQLRRFQEIAASMPPNPPDVMKSRLYAKLAVASQNLGRERDAIDYFSKVYDLLPKVRGEVATHGAR